MGEMDAIDLIILLIIGFIAGNAAVALMSRYRRQNAILNTAIGVVGAVVGQFVFRQLDIDLEGEFFSRSISIAEVTIAFVGALLLLLVAYLVRR
jgi:uncharacterized membrane protein YeaQ/YmgE (transglycosylase-associated protein family)